MYLEGSGKDLYVMEISVVARIRHGGITRMRRYFFLGQPERESRSRTYFALRGSEKKPTKCTLHALIFIFLSVHPSGSRVPLSTTYFRHLLSAFNFGPVFLSASLGISRTKKWFFYDRCTVNELGRIIM